MNHKYENKHSCNEVLQTYQYCCNKMTTFKSPRFELKNVLIYLYYTSKIGQSYNMILHHEYVLPHINNIYNIVQ